MSELTWGMEASPLSGEELELAIEPIVGWRRWVVSPSRWWETSTGPVLRGAWGRAWPERHLAAGCLIPPIRPTRMLGGFISILDQQESGRHERPPPYTGCSCGVYAMKPGKVDPRLPAQFGYLPVVTGFVELSGRVIEGASGYRGEKATVVPPVELSIPCAGGLVTSSPCPNRPSQVFELDYEYRGLCAMHLGSLTGQLVDHWLSTVLARILVRYQVDVVTVEKGRQSDGYR